IGVSRTPNPLGKWRLYRVAIDAEGAQYADQPHVGFNAQWIVVGTDIFEGVVRRSARLLVFDKDDLYRGGRGKYTRVLSAGVPSVTYDPSAGAMYVLIGGGQAQLSLYALRGPVGAETLDKEREIIDGTPEDNATVVTNRDIGPQRGSSVGIDLGDADVQNV